MKKIITILLFFLIYISSFAQESYSRADRIASKAPNTDELSVLSDYFNKKLDNNIDKVRAFYVWLANNIEYSVEDMYRVEYYNTTEQLIKKVLTTRKAVCHGYAEVMNELNQRAGIKSFVVSGYIRQNGKISNIPHSWVVAQIDSSWYVFDPTWGAGYIENNQFVKRLNNDYFMVKPETSIHTRMPYDPMWQLLYHPYSHQDFYKDESPVSKKNYFNFKDSINHYAVETEVQQLEESLRRIKQGGFKNNLISDYYSFYDKQLEIQKANEIIFICNQAVDQFNEAVSSYNKYVEAKNHHFNSFTDEQVRNMISSPEELLKRAQDILLTANTNNKDIKTNISKQIRQIRDLQKIVGEEINFVNKYCSTKKSQRPSLFFKPR